MARLVLDCSHRPPCPGCPHFGRSGVPPEAFTAMAAFARQHGLRAPKVTEGPLQGFRHRTRLSVRGRVGSPKIGIFELGTHRLVHIPRCVVHHPLVNAVAGEVRSAMVEHSIAPYSDQAHLGCVRALQVVVERSSQAAQVTLVTRDEEPSGLEALFRSLERRLGPRLHSLFWNSNLERTNTVLGPTFRRVTGPDAVVESFDGVRIHYPPGAFGQSNLPVFDALSAHVRSLVPDGLRVLELYGGTGALGLPLARRARQLEINEVAPGSLDGLRRSIAQLPAELADRVSVLPGSASEYTARVAESDVIIADPPRKGLDAAVLEQLAAAPPMRLVYVSCGLASFLADSARLLERGGLRLTSLELFAMFPFTEHVETVALFERR